VCGTGRSAQRGVSIPSAPPLAAPSPIGLPIDVRVGIEY